MGGLKKLIIYYLDFKKQKGQVVWTCMSTYNRQTATMAKYILRGNMDGSRNRGKLRKHNDSNISVCQEEHGRGWTGNS